jgi:1-acyl-sn-glycerol-3-phosphate acyltransferase
MLYYVFRWFITLFYQLFYKRVSIYGKGNIPKGKPTIIAADHTNALVDPLMIAVFIRRGIYFLVRADIFKSKFLIWLFNQIHMKPVYRPRDGADYVQKNEVTFAKVDEWLVNNKAVLIFPEGNCEKEKRLRALKKGTVRMAFSAWEKGKTDISIVPTGINYTHFDEMRSDIFISYGKPIYINDYKAAFEGNPAKAYRLANRDLLKAMRSEMIIIEDKTAENVAEKLLEIGRNDFPAPRFPIMSKDERFLRYEQRITRNVNQLFKNDQAAFAEFETKIDTYFNQLNTLNTTDRALMNYKQPNSFMVLLFAPIAKLLGKALHYPILHFQKKSIALAKKDATMLMTFWSGFSIGFYIAFGFLFMLIGPFIFGFVFTLGILIILIFLTYWSGVILEIRKSDLENTALDTLETTKAAEIKALKTMRLEFSKFIRQ